MKWGLNLYSIRNYLDSEAHFSEAAERLANMGYSQIQFSGAAFEPEMIGRVCKKYGLETVLTHVPLDRILNDTDKLMREHESIGCRYIGLGSMNVSDAEKCTETIKQLDRVGEYMEARGFKFFYHHHHFEFTKRNGKTVFDEITDAPHIHLTLDTYWLQYGGADIISTIDRLGGRAECLHLKDYMITEVLENGNKKYAPVFAPVGDGVLDFHKIIAHAKVAGTEYYLVEQDNAAQTDDTLGQVERSVKYLKKNFGE